MRKGGLFLSGKRVGCGDYAITNAAFPPWVIDVQEAREMEMGVIGAVWWKLR